jgi:hypothetical protein
MRQPHIKILGFDSYAFEILDEEFYKKEMEIKKLTKGELIAKKENAILYQEVKLLSEKIKILETKQEYLNSKIYIEPGDEDPQ